MATLTETSGLVGRFRYSTLGLSEGAEISSITSEAGGAVTLSQSEPAFRPINRDLALGGRDAAEHDGTDARMAGGVSNYGRGVDGFTVYTVLNATSSTSTRQILTFSTGASTTSARFILWSDASVPAIGGRRLDSDSFQRVSSSHNISDGNPHVLCAVVNYANATAQIYVDGTQRLSTSFLTAGTSSATDSQRIVVGSHLDLGREFFRGLLSEALIYHGAHSSSTRSSIHSYVQEEYGITVSDYVASQKTVTLASSLTPAGAFRRGRVTKFFSSSVRPAGFSGIYRTIDMLIEGSLTVGGGVLREVLGRIYGRPGKAVASWRFAGEAIARVRRLPPPRWTSATAPRSGEAD